MTISLSTLAVRTMVAGFAVVAASACGGSGGSSGGNPPATSSGTSSTPASASGGGSLADLQSSLTAGQNATFKAVYTSTDSGGTDTVTIEQQPPKSLFKDDSGELISDGTTTNYCSNGSGSTPSCVAETGANPLTGVVSLYSGSTYLPIFQAAQSELAAHLAGVSINFSTETFAGESSKCVSISGGSSSDGGKYCVTDSGILAYVGNDTSNFHLTSYSTTVDSADFTVPAGASTTAP